MSNSIKSILILVNLKRYDYLRSDEYGLHININYLLD